MMATTNAKFKLGIFENGITPEQFITTFGSYPQMIESWLKPWLPEAEFTYISPVRGEPLPNPQDFDGYLLSGSAHSSYEKTPWMIALIAFLQQLPALKIPVFGICFGHQIMADAYGGKTTKAIQGWGVGAQQYQYEDKLLPKANNTLIFHQDQVTTLPADAICVGHSSHCLNGMLIYSFPAASVQFHPEFSPAYVRVLVEKYQQSLLSTEIAENALVSLDKLSVDNSQMGQWVAKFFRKYIHKN